MAIVSVNEHYLQRPCKETVEGRTYQRAFKVMLNARTVQDPKLVLDAPGVPAIYATYPPDPDYWCTTRTPDISDTQGYQWVVVCGYERRPGRSGLSWDIKAPTDEPPVVTFSWNRYTKAVERAYRPLGSTPDTQGTPTIPVLNSAYMAFPSPLADEYFMLVVEVQRKEKERDTGPAKWARFQDTLNATPITIGGVRFAPLTGLLQRVKGDPKWSAGGVPYWSVSYVIEYNPEGHTKKILDQGYYYKNYGGGSGELQRAVDAFNKAMTRPVLLNGTTGDLAPGDPPEAAYVEFQTKYALDWGTLRLPADVFG